MPALFPGTTAVHDDIARELAIVEAVLDEHGAITRAVVEHDIFPYGEIIMLGVDPEGASGQCAIEIIAADDAVHGAMDFHGGLLHAPLDELPAAVQELIVHDEQGSMTHIQIICV